MKTDSKIIISIDKQFYSENDEIRIHVWFNHEFYTYATLTILSPAGITIDSAGLKTDTKTTETFAFTCGGPFMFENGCYTIRVQCENVISENMFEYYNSKNRLKPKL
ncbi:hypothetical protein [Nitrosarchaeum sp.]|uniref:hypothetical protein n=1 Tax=Nitrosarchaeum sp. TaxID=2026886 RepID=UPI00247B61B1|nr:hypothetical protein [Nitrosarchaeum sp.]MCV0411545.1 hypothetical protein [Nitrosarchaeum sp.]